MFRIARRVPAERDAEVAGWAPSMLISQLTRALKSCPEIPVADDRPVDAGGRQRCMHLSTEEQGWGSGSFCLPPDETAVLNVALGAARDAEFRDRNGLAVDAEVLIATYAAGRLLGIHPTLRTVSRHLRRVIERRDQGCTHPLCTQTRWLQIHHIDYWEDGGLTVPVNLTCLCQLHHRELHLGEFTIEGD